MCYFQDKKEELRKNAAVKLREFEKTKFSNIEEVKDLTKGFLAGEFFDFVKQCLPDDIKAELGNNFLKLLENPNSAQNIVPQVLTWVNFLQLQIS